MSLWRGRAPRIGTRIAAFTVVLFAGVVVLPGVASAHVYLVGSNPPDGTSLAVAPKAITIDWSSDVNLQYATSQLTDLSGHAVALPPLSVDPVRPNRLVVTLPSLPPQAYRLTFSVRDDVDLHRSTGSIAFAVGGAQAPPPTRPPHPGPALFEVLMRWVARVGMFFGIGSLVVALFVVPRALPAGDRRRRLVARLVGLAIVGSVIAIVGDTAVLAYEANGIGSLWPTFTKLLTESSYGHRWQVGVVWGAAFIVACAWLRYQLRLGVDVAGVSPLVRPDGSRSRAYVPVAACALALAQAVTIALSSHSSSSGGPSTLGVAFRTVHLVAVGTWIGGLAALVVAVPALRRTDADGEAVAGGLLRAFSPVAAVGLAAVTASGLMLMGIEISTVTALVATWYGWILLVKLAVFAGVVALGLRHFRLLRAPARPAPGRSVAARVRSTLRIEVAAAAVVVLLGAALAATLPARGPQFAAAPTAIPSLQTGNAHDLVVSVFLSPNRPGSDLASAQVANTRRPAPGPITGVTMILRPPLSAPTIVRLTKTSIDHWDGAPQTLRSGPLDVEVDVARVGLPVATAHFAWTVNPVAQWRQRTIVSSARLAPITTALAVMVVLAAAAALYLMRRRRDPTSRVDEGDLPDAAAGRAPRPAAPPRVRAGAPQTSS